MQRKSTRTIRWIASLFVAAICGCGESEPLTGQVKGVVLLDGKPVTTGHVITIPSKGKGASGEIQPDGSFVLRTPGIKTGGVMAGTHQVIVSSYEGGPTIKNPEAPSKLLVPKRYTEMGTSGLAIDVVAGESQDIKLELTTSE